MSSTIGQIKAPYSTVGRRLYVKRRSQSTGLFESDWQEITKDVISWGKIKTAIDTTRISKFTFPNVRIVVSNIFGKYNPEDDSNSFWYGYAAQQRSLIKIEGFFIEQTKSNGVWTNNEFPTTSFWDDAIFDDIYEFDGNSTMFVGVISGDIDLSDNDQVNLNIKPLNEIFRQYAARNLTGYTTTGMTASEFMTSLRDQQDLSGAYIFRPFFGDTTTSWEINSTTNIFTDLNTSGAENIIDKNVWEVIESLSEAENHVSYIDKEGFFRFQPRDATTTSSFTFNGPNIRDGAYGQTIKQIRSFGKKYSKYYSRIEIKHDSDDTATSYEVIQSPLQVTGGNVPWYFGERTYSIENLWINSATAQTIGDAIYDEVSNIRDEINFTSSFVPQLNILDRIIINYDSTPADSDSFLDNRNWADTAGATPLDSDLIWDAAKGNNIRLNNIEFKLLSVEHDLDKFESNFEARRA